VPFKSISVFLVSCFLSVSIMVAPAIAQDKEARALEIATAAAAHYGAVGETQAFKDFSDSSKGFIDGEIYVVVVDMNHVIKHHAANPKLSGRDASKLKDPTGKLFVQEMVSLNKAGKSDWVDFRWTNPATKKIGNKRTYALGAHGLSFQVGYYQ